MGEDGQESRMRNEKNEKWGKKNNTQLMKKSCHNCAPGKEHGYKRDLFSPTKRLKWVRGRPSRKTRAEMGERRKIGRDLVQLGRLLDRRNKKKTKLRARGSRGGCGDGGVIDEKMGGY